MRNSKDMFDDAEVPDEHDPDFMEEMFELYKNTGIKPEQLMKDDPCEAKKYAAWLKKEGKTKK